MIEITANIIALIGCILMVAVGYIKDKKIALIVQIIQMILLAITDFMLGSITGTLINILGIIRNILCYKNSLSKLSILIIVFASVYFGYSHNTLGFIGLLPVINNIIFILFINTKSKIGFKILIITSMILWFIHDIYIKSYVTALFDIFTIVSSIIAIIQIKKKTH